MAKRTHEELAKLFSKRFEDYNTKVIQDLADIIKQFNGLTYTQAHKLAQQLKYNKSYKKIVDELSSLSGKTQKEIKTLLEEAVKENIEFEDLFFKARNMDTPVYEKDGVLKEIVDSVAKVSSNDFINISKSTGFRLLDNNNKPLYLDIEETYKKVIDNCVYAVSTGKDTFNNVMRRTINQLTDSGVRKIYYNNEGKVEYSQRIDTAVRRNIMDSIRAINIETNKELGKRFRYDGIEVTVHLFPAPDHEKVQGHQFRNKEFNKFQNDEDCVDVKGIKYPAVSDETGHDRRSIGQYNCYHGVIPIIVGLTQPLYTDEQLQKIIDDNEKGVEIDGKHYTLYEATQLQRQIETEIRKSKDAHIMYKTISDRPAMLREQKRITLLTQKYNEITKKSNIPNLLKERARVSGYRPIKSLKTAELGLKDNKNIAETNIKTKRVYNKEDLLLKWDVKFKNDNIEVRHILKSDPVLIDKQVSQIDNLLNKYKFIKNSINKDSETNKLIIQSNTPDLMGENNYARFFGGHYIEFNEKYFKDGNLLYDKVKNKIEENWWQEIDYKKYNLYPTTHEFGHLLEFKMIEQIEKKSGKIGSLFNKDYINGDLAIKKQILNNVPDWQKYLSDYGKSKEGFEWFAEIFTQMELGKKTPLTEALKKYIDDFTGGNYEYFR